MTGEPDVIIVLPPFPLIEALWFHARWAGTPWVPTPFGSVAYCVPDGRQHGRSICT
ncbi:MAG: hypothetical protein JWN86_3611 [Planctomycetota bacterium]|nr:hypothetical protein [Planctomycetota bacterium]